MAFASVGTLGSNQSKASSTTVVITTAAAAEVGNVIVVETAWNNTDTADGDTNRLSCADSAGNTYVKVKERTETTGAADDGATCALFYTVVTTELASGGTITVTSDTARPAKAANAWEFTKDAGTTLAVEQTVTGQGNGVDMPGVTLTGMTSRGYLLIFAGAHENNSTLTQDADYLALTTNGTTGGGAETNMRIFGGYRIATLTADTNDSTVASTVGAVVAILTAIYEVAGAAAPGPPGRVPRASASALTRRRM